MSNKFNHIKICQFDSIKFINNLNFIFLKFSAYSSYYQISNYIEVQVKKNFKNKVYGNNINNNDLYKNLNLFINQLDLPFFFFLLSEQSVIPFIDKENN
jgi:hypothetical protein